MIKKLAATTAVTFALLAGVASAQTTTDATTPTAPNTGAGGNTMANVITLSSSALLALAGIVYLGRRYSVR